MQAFFIIYFLFKQQLIKFVENRFHFIELVVKVRVGMENDLITFFSVYNQFFLDQHKTHIANIHDVM